MKIITLLLLFYSSLGFSAELQMSQKNSRYIEFEYKGIQFNSENTNLAGLLIGNISKNFHLGIFAFYNLSPNENYQHLFEDYFHLSHYEGVFFEYRIKYKENFSYSLRLLSGLSFSHVTEVDLDVAQSGLSPAWVVEPALAFEYSVSKFLRLGTQFSYINILDKWSFSPNYYMGSFNIKVVL